MYLITKWWQSSTKVVLKFALKSKSKQYLYVIFEKMQPAEGSRYLPGFICVCLSSTLAADQVLLVPEPFCQSHITIFICECVPGFFRCEITYQALFIVFLHKVKLLLQS